MHSAEFTIRTAGRADAPAIYLLHKESFFTLCATHYPLELLQRWFSSKTVEGYYPALDQGEMFVCERAGVVVGFGHAIPGEVAGIFVHPDFVRQGIGSRLLDHAIQCARPDPAAPIKLYATLNAEDFYARRGFCAVARYAVSRGDINFPVVEMVLQSGQTPLTDS